MTLPQRRAVGAAPAPQRRAPASALRRTSRLVLVVGTVTSTAAAFGPAWVVRGGTLVALAAAFVACLFAWREIVVERRLHAAAMLAASRAHGAALHEERMANAAVLDILTAHGRAIEADLEAERNLTVDLRGDLAALDVVNRDLGGQVRRQEARIHTLSRTIAERDAELAVERTAAAEARREVAELTATEERDTAGIRTLPRRMRVDPDSGPVETVHTQAAAAHTPAARDAEVAGDAAWSADELRAVRALSDGIGMMLPNYEGERRLA